MRIKGCGPALSYVEIEIVRVIFIFFDLTSELPEPGSSKMARLLLGKVKFYRNFIMYRD